MGVTEIIGLWLMIDVILMVGWCLLVSIRQKWWRDK